jgi:hypothetical protein
MRAKIIANVIGAGSVARDFVRLVKGWRNSPLKEAKEQKRGGAQAILECMLDQEQPEGDLEVDISGKVVIQQMDRDLQDFEAIPYWYTDVARSRGEGICPGVYVIITSDSSGKKYRVTGVSFSRQAIRIKDVQGNAFLLPWELAEPCQREGNERPYWFTSQAKSDGQDLQCGDYVSLTCTDEKYELMDIIWSSGNLRIRSAGHIEQLFLPWRFIRPYEEESSK